MLASVDAVPTSENGKPMQILHYQNAEEYKPHFDFFHDKLNQVMGRKQKFLEIQFCHRIPSVESHIVCWS